MNFFVPAFSVLYFFLSASHNPLVVVKEEQTLQRELTGPLRMQFLHEKFECFQASITLNVSFVGCSDALGHFLFHNMNKVEGGEIKEHILLSPYKVISIEFLQFFMGVPALIGTGTSVFGKVTSDFNVCSMITKQNSIFRLLG